jgi:hypothetical protein
VARKSRRHRPQPGDGKRHGQRPDSFIIEVRSLSRKTGGCRARTPDTTRPPVTGGQAAGLMLAGPVHCWPGNYDVIPVPGSPRQSPGITRGGDLCTCSRHTISCAAL